MTDETKRPARGRKRAAAKRGPGTTPWEVLTCLPETEAILAINAGAIIGPVPAVVSAGAGDVRCWSGSVPRAVIRAIEESGPQSRAFVFRISFAGSSRQPPDRLQLPISIGRVIAVLLESKEYQQEVLARLVDFPDASLSAVDVRVEPTVFGAADPSVDLFTPPIGMREDSKGESQTPRGDKGGGAVAGLLTAISVSSALGDDAADQAWRAVGSSAAGEGDDTDLILRVGRALSVGEPDAVSVAVTRAAIGRLRHRSTRTGFDPQHLLDAITNEVRPSLAQPEIESLQRFFEAAGSILRVQAGASREMLHDGGDVMLRGLVAFLRTPSLERLESLALRGGRVGPRVGAFAMTLAGFFEGTGAIPARLKAVPRERLLALGDVTEALGTKGNVVVETATRCEGGKLLWVGSLMGREVLRQDRPLASGLSGVVAAAGGEKWRVSVVGGQLELRPQGDSSPHAVLAIPDVIGPCFPETRMTRLSLAIPWPKKIGQLEQAMRRASVHGLILELEDSEARRLVFARYLNVGYAPTDAAKAVSDLLDAANAVMRSGKPARRARTGKGLDAKLEVPADAAGAPEGQ